MTIFWCQKTKKKGVKTNLEEEEKGRTTKLIPKIIAQTDETEQINTE